MKEATPTAPRARAAGRAARRGPAPLLLVAGVLFARIACGQAPVVEADRESTQAGTSAPAPVAPAPAADVDGSVATLFHQIQMLQDELRFLQGVIEEQGHRIDRLTREQRDRYIDLDQRLLQLRGGGTTEAPAAAGPLGPGADGAESEEQAYKAASDAMKMAREQPPAERDAAFAQALGLFDALIAAHPNGALTANAFYWRGEIELSRGNLEPARQAFAQLLLMFADHAKVPLALYKLGVVHHRLGEDSTALGHLDRVVAEYPEHSAARLARAYAAELR